MIMGRPSYLPFTMPTINYQASLKLDWIVVGGGEHSLSVFLCFYYRGLWREPTALASGNKWTAGAGLAT